MSDLSRFDLSGTIALVTGCKRGIGKAMAIGLAESFPLDAYDHDPADDSSAKKDKKIDKSAGFNPYDTGVFRRGWKD